MFQRISIENMAGFDKFETNLPAIALIQGANGQGKTSLVRCIQYVGDDGHDPDIVPSTAESGEIVLTLDNGDQFRAVASRKTGETRRMWKPKDGKKWIPGRKQIDSLCRSVTYNPLAFQAFTEKAQLEHFLAVMPVEAKPGEIETAVGKGATEMMGDTVKTPGTGNALDVIAAYEKRIRELRRDYHVGADTQEKHAAELEKALPPDPPAGTDWAAEAVRLREAKESLDGAEREAIDAIGKAFQDAKDAAEKASRDTFRAIDSEIDAKIKALETERQNRKQAEADKCGAVIETAREEANSKVEMVQEKIAPERERIVSDLTTAELRDKEYTEALGTRKAIAAAKTSAEQKRRSQMVLEVALENLANLRKVLVARLPIPEIRFDEKGRICREEGAKLVPFSKWNQSDKDLFCIRIALIANASGFVCLDNVIDNLDPERRVEFMQTVGRYAKEKGIQWFVATASTSGALEVVDGTGKA